jgi:hypothetical protein
VSIDWLFAALHSGSVQFSTSIDLSNDRILFQSNDVVVEHGTTNNRTQFFVWNTNGSASNTPLASIETSVNGLQSWATISGDTGTPTSSSQTVYNQNTGVRTGTYTAPDNSYTVAAYSYGRLQSVVQKDAGNKPIHSTTYTYDSFGRVATNSDGRDGATVFSYYPNTALPLTVTSPVPGAGQSAEVFTGYYDLAGRLASLKYADNTVVSNVMTPLGLTGVAYGSRQFPTGLWYDSQGRMTAMTNWAAFPTGGARSNVWNYDSARGWLNSKQYPDTKQVFYGYTDAGRLSTRTWARNNLLTTYGYTDGNNRNYGDAPASRNGHAPVGGSFRPLGAGGVIAARRPYRKTQGGGAMKATIWSPAVWLCLQLAHFCGFPCEVGMSRKRRREPSN